MVQQMTLLAKCLLILLALSAILNILLMCLNSSKVPKCQSSQPIWKYHHTDQAKIFADLSQDEYHQVRDYMWAQKSLGISHSAFAEPKENFIFLIDLALPKKAEALRYLNEHGPAPVREASVVVFCGSLGHIKEYVVGPLGGELKYRDVTEEKYNQTALKITARPATMGEYTQLFKFLDKEVFGKLEEIMKKSFDFSHEKPLLPFML